jgi:hypothetical protein
MINFNDFRKFDRVKTLDPFEQQRQYWMFRNNALNPILSKGGAGAGASSGGKRRLKEPTIIPSGFFFFTVSGEQFTTQLTDLVIKTSTGYAKAFYPYDVATPIFGTGDETLDIEIEFNLLNFWDGVLPFKILSCDIDGNLTGDITYLKFDGLANLKSIDFTDSKDDLTEIDVSDCVDLEQIIIPSSISLGTLNFGNCKVSDIDLNGCEYLENLSFSGNTFQPVYTLDLSLISTLKFITGDGSVNLWGVATSASTLEQVSLNDCGDLSSLVCNNFSGNGGAATIYVKNCSFGPAGLDNLYTSLSVANGTNRTIYVYNNSGIGSSNPSFATDKNYIVDTNA